MDDRVILRIGSKILTPFIMVFALYVQFHGDYGPGGGFQAGVILSAAFALYGLVYGLANVLRVLPPVVPYVCGALGVTIYAGTGFVTMLLGGNFLGYNVLAHDPIHGQHYGILAIELGVITTVFGVMVGLFFILRRAQEELMEALGLFNYWVVVVLMMLGFYTVIARGNLVKKLIGLTIFQTSVFILYISTGKITGGTPPYLLTGEEGVVYSNPIPHVLILTAIVVGVATMAVGLSLVVRIKEAYGTIEEDEIEDKAL